MKITEIKASYGQTIQFRQYEPVNVHVSLKAEVADGDTGNQLSNLQKHAEKLVTTEIQSLKEEREKMDTELFADKIPEIIKSISECKNREDRITLWESTPVEIRRITEVKEAFKKNI